MNTKQSQEYRKALSDLARRLRRNLANDQREVMHMDLTDLPSGPLPATAEVPDGGIHEVEIGLIANEQGLLDEVTGALARLDAGTFGRCESCGAAIAKSRLDAVPYARRCIQCERKSETQPIETSR